MSEPLVKDPARARLIPVNGPNDSPDEAAAITVQFNPNSLKVALSNTLKANPREGATRAAQFVDKSSSTLAVELIFDTTVAPGAGGGGAAAAEGSDVRQLTRRIAEKFMKPVEAGQEMRAPSRCLFQWGAFEFVGLVQSFDETLDFFSPEGRPLRATVALKLSEDRFQFRTRNVDAAARDTPTLTATGGDPDGEGEGQNQNSVSEANQEAGRNPRDWRDTALYNGIENPRLPAAAALAVPRRSPGTAPGAPAFRFGASAALGTAIPGAFAPAVPGAAPSAGAAAPGGSPAPGAARPRTNIGFD